MTSIDTDSRSVERLLPLIHTQLCSSTATPSDRDDATWMSGSLERWRRCFHVWRKVIGSDVVFLVLLFHSGCIWSPDYNQLTSLLADDDGEGAATEDEADEEEEAKTTWQPCRPSTHGTLDVMRALRQHEPSVWALEVLHFIRLFELYETERAVEKQGTHEHDGDSEDHNHPHRGVGRGRRTEHDRAATVDPAEADGASPMATLSSSTSTEFHGHRLPVGHSTLLLEALAARVVAVAVAEGDPITLPKKNATSNSSSSAAHVTMSASTPSESISGGSGGGGAGGARASDEAAAAVGIAEREEVLKQLLVSLADRDEVVVQHVATQLVERWFAFTTSSSPSAASSSAGHQAGGGRVRAHADRAHRDYYFASAIKFAAYVDGVLSALYEENAHINAVLTRQHIPAGPLQRVLQTTVPSILCCLLVEEAVTQQEGAGTGRGGAPRASSTAAPLDTPLPCLPPQAMLLPYHVLGRGSSVSVWLPAGGTPRGGMRDDAPSSSFVGGSSSNSGGGGGGGGGGSPRLSSPSSWAAAGASASGPHPATRRGQFVPSDVCSDGVQWVPAGTAVPGTRPSRHQRSPMTLGLRFRPEIWWTATTSAGYGAHAASRDLSYASVTAVFPATEDGGRPAVPPRSPLTPTSPRGAARGAFTATWACDGSEMAHSYLRVDALMPRVIFASALPLASSPTPETSNGNSNNKSGPTSDKARSQGRTSGATAVVSYVHVVDRLVARALETAKGDLTHPSPAPSGASRKRGRGVAPARGHATHALASAHPLLHTEGGTATLVSFGGSSSSLRAVQRWVTRASAAGAGGARARRAHAVASAAEVEEDEEDEEKGGQTVDRRRRAAPSSSSSARGRRRGRQTAAPHAVSRDQSLDHAGASDSVDASHATRTLTRLLTHDYHYTHVHIAPTRSASTALRAGLSRDPIAVVAQFLHLTGRRVLALRALVPDQSASSSASSEPRVSRVIATGIGKAAGRVRGGEEGSEADATSTIHYTHGGAGSASHADEQAKLAAAEHASVLLVTTASSLSLAALVLAHNVVEKVLLAQNATTLWTTELASTLVDLALLTRTRPHAALLRAAGLGVCVLPQRPQSLLVMVGLVAAVAARQRAALVQRRSGTTEGPVSAATGGVMWWGVFDQTVLQDPTMPGLFFPGTWRLLESATDALKETAQTLLKGTARPRLTSLRGTAVPPPPPSPPPPSPLVPLGSHVAEELGPAHTPHIRAVQAGTTGTFPPPPTGPDLATRAAPPPFTPRREETARAHGGLLAPEMLPRAHVACPAIDDDDSGGPTTALAADSSRGRAEGRVTRTLGLWCSPEASLPRAAGTGPTPFTVELESGVQGHTRVFTHAAHAPRASPLAERLALPVGAPPPSLVSASSASSPDSATPQARRLALRPVTSRQCHTAPAEMAHFVYGAPRPHSTDVEETGTAVDKSESERARELLIRQAQWVWLFTENAATDQRARERGAPSQ